MMMSAAGLPFMSPRERTVCTESCDLGDVRQLDRRPAAVAHDERPVVRRLHQLVVGADQPVLVGLERLPLASLAVCGGDRRADVLELQAVGVELGRVDVDPHGGGRTAAHDDLPDPGICDSFCARIVEAAS
jgi:hypothetical protein